MRRTWSLVASSESCSDARAAGAEAICTVPVTVCVSLPPVSTMPPITPAATSALAAIAAGSGRSDSDQRRRRRGALAAGAAAGSSARAPAAASSSASERTMVMMRSRSSGGGSTCTAASGSVSAATCRSATSRRHSVARRQVRLEALVLVVGQRAQHVGARVVACRAQALMSSPPPGRRAGRAASRGPRRMRPFTVPMGVSSIDAISEWVKPPK